MNNLTQILKWRKYLGTIPLEDVFQTKINFVLYN